MDRIETKYVDVEDGNQILHISNPAGGEIGAWVSSEKERKRIIDNSDLRADFDGTSVYKTKKGNVVLDVGKSSNITIFIEITGELIRFDLNKTSAVPHFDKVRIVDKAGNLLAEMVNGVKEKLLRKDKEE